MLHKITGSAAMLMFASAAALTAQGPERMAAHPATDADHAIIGELVRVNPNAETFSIMGPRETEHKFRFDESTMVHQFMNGTAMTDLGGETGAVLVVHLEKSEDGKLMARSVRYVGAGPLKATKGTVKLVDKYNKVLVIENKMGAEESFQLNDGTAVEAKSGLVPLDAFVSKLGHTVTVFWTTEGEKRHARLIEEMETTTS